MGETNKVVVRFSDGQVLKGTTEDFFPNRPSFHLRPLGTSEVQDIRCKELKAVFFVKDFAGNPRHRDIQSFVRESGGANQGRKIAALFKDGELICGYTLTYAPEREGFFVSPSDPGSNNLRVYVLAHATQEVKVGAEAEAMVRRQPGSRAA